MVAIQLDSFNFVALKVLAMAVLGRLGATNGIKRLASSYQQKYFGGGLVIIQLWRTNYHPYGIGRWFSLANRVKKIASG